jgi:hypothetical protein
VLQRIKQLASQRDGQQQQVAAAQQWQARWRESEAALDEALTSKEAATRCAGLHAPRLMLYLCTVHQHDTLGARSAHASMRGGV